MPFIHNFSPEILNIGPVILRWYGLLFALGLILNYLYTSWVFRKEKLPVKDWESIAIYLFLGLVIGARFGEVLFYNFSYFLDHPLEIFMVWKGGLSSHGAAIGVFVAYLLWTRVHGMKFAKYVDFLALGMPLTAFFVRMGNFMNSEIVGKPTGSDSGVIFSRLGEDFARYPVQLYEGFWSLLIFVVMFLIYKRGYKWARVPLFFMFFYILTYFLGRFFIEFAKDVNTLPEWIWLNNGQILSILPGIAGLIYFIWFYPRMRKKI